MNARSNLVFGAAVFVAVMAGGTVAVSGASPGSTAPPVLPSQSINGLAFDSAGRLFGADCWGAHIFRFDASGPVVVAGTGIQAYAGDGGPATEASLYCPFGPAFDERGMFIVDHGNNRIRLVDAEGVISTFAGSGPAGVDEGSFGGDGGPALEAAFQEPSGMAIADDGTIYVGDRDNDVVRRIDPSGIVTTIAGTGKRGFSGDGGPATQAMLAQPIAIALDPAGNVYVVDTGNLRVRRVDPNGIITTIAGTGEAASSGDGGPATEAALETNGTGLLIDAPGNIFVTEGQRVRRIDSEGVITTYAGTGEVGTSGDGGPATEANLEYPAALAMDAQGVLYVSGDGDKPICIRSITPEGVIDSLWCPPKP